MTGQAVSGSRDRVTPTLPSLGVWCSSSFLLAGWGVAGGFLVVTPRTPGDTGRAGRKVWGSGVRFGLGVAPSWGVRLLCSDHTVERVEGRPGKP